MATKKVIPIFTTCASCTYCVRAPEGSGDPDYYCFYSPPAVIVFNDGVEDTVYSMRPVISTSDHICSHFKGKH